MNEEKIYYHNGQQISKNAMKLELSSAKQRIDDYVNDLYKKHKIDKSLAEDIKSNMYIPFDIAVHLLAPEFEYASIKPYLDNKVEQ